MELAGLPFKKKGYILALGAESAGVFAVYKNGTIFISENFGDLLDNASFLKYKREVLVRLAKEKTKPDIIITDLHPLYNSTIFGQELAKKFEAKHIKTQHHVAHIFSAIGDSLANSEWQMTNSKIPKEFIGIAADGTGYGLDGTIWGGEVFRLQIANSKWQMAKTERIGSLEEQVMIGGDLAVREPARMLIAILAKIPNHKFRITNKSQTTNLKNQKDFIYKYVKKFYTRNEFEALYSQLEQGFNCQKTTSTGRVMDAVSVLLGFSGNERNYKHEAVKKLEENSTKPYDDLELRIMNQESRKILGTTHLFEYLIKNIGRDKKRLAATAQLYLAKSLYKIVEPYAISHMPLAIFAAGGMTNNKIISEYLEKKSVYLSKKIPRGDEGIAFGQIIFCLNINRRG